MKRDLTVGLLGFCVTVATVLVATWASIAFERWSAIAEDVARAAPYDTILAKYGDPVAMMHRDGLTFAFIACPIAAIVGGLFCGATASRKPFVALSIALAPVFVAIFFTVLPSLVLIAALAVSTLVGGTAEIGIRRSRFRRT